MFRIDITRYLVVGGLALATASITGCSKDDSSAKATAAKATTGAATGADLDAVNAAVPEALAGTLSFTTATIDDEVDAVVPEGWEPSKFIPGSYDPPAGADFGFFTKYKVGSNCDGMCSKKDWAAVVEKVEFGQLGGATIEKDEKLDNGRLVVANTGDRVRVIAAWWKADAGRYFYCRAELDGKARDAAAAFESACRNTRPRF